MSVVLVVNSGSSSFKYQLIEIETELVLGSGRIERIGEGMSDARHSVTTLPLAPGTPHPGTPRREDFTRHLPVTDHSEAVQAMLAACANHGPSLTSFPPMAVGHRVVHGGMRFLGPTLVTPHVTSIIRDLVDLAPLHNPGALQGIAATTAVLPSIPHVAVFDTAFHQTLPPAAYRYAIDESLAAHHQIRRYGFHGTSFKYVSEEAARFLNRPVAGLNQIVLHLGNGASACAIVDGRSIDTSMGMTPLEGLVMGTRSGDIDPAIPFHLHRQTALDFDELEAMLNQRSGLFGMTGQGDLRDVQAAAASGDAAAGLAIDVYVHRLRHYLGAYIAELGRVDVIVFTAGVGENNAALRAHALRGLEPLGIRLDPHRNEEARNTARRISPDGSPIEVLVVPTHEELEIARQTFTAIHEQVPL